VCSSDLRAYFEALAARDALDTALRLERVVQGGSRAAEASAARGLASGLDAQIAELIGVRLTQARIAAERDQSAALSALTSLLGRDPSASMPELNGELTPLSHVGGVQLSQLTAAAEDRPELAQAKDLRGARASGLTALKRSRVPNVRVSVFAQSDGFSERVLGAGLAVPIPLPYPLGQTAYGDIAEARALLRQADADVEAVRRGVKLELATALHVYRAAEAERALYTLERVERAEQSLKSLADELRAGRLSIGEAVIAQQTLVEFLRAHVAAKLGLCLASIELARAAGLSLEGSDL
jgi:cobalt-zinc-cadmium efflux system outer membrane protein